MSQALTRARASPLRCACEGLAHSLHTALARPLHCAFTCTALCHHARVRVIFRSLRLPLLSAGGSVPAEDAHAVWVAALGVGVALSNPAICSLPSALCSLFTTLCSLHSVHCTAIPSTVCLIGTVCSTDNVRLTDAGAIPSTLRV